MSTKVNASARQTLSLMWPGKEQAVAAAWTACGKRLEFQPALSVPRRKEHAGRVRTQRADADSAVCADTADAGCVLGSARVEVAAGCGVVVEGDNLDALKLLLPQYRGRVDLIYIDPPYNTGNAFVYHDAYEHAAWLTMMYPRLVLAREMLAASGCIFISIDDNEIDNLRLVMSEIFGEENFVAQITVRSNPRGRQAKRHFARVHEYLLVYARDTMQLQLAGANLTDNQTREFNRIDENGRRYRLLGLRQRGAHSLRQDRPAMFFPIYVDPNNCSISLEPGNHTHIVLPKKSTGQEGRWMWSKERTAQSLHLLEARLIKTRNEFDIFVRDYFDDEHGTTRKRKLTTIWDDKALNYQNGKRELKLLLGRSLLDYPKPPALLHKILALVGKPDALCMDFFAGSGTLGQVVLEANAEDGGTRRFILVQIAEPTGDEEFPTIADICRSRLAKVVSNLGARIKQAGFACYAIAD